MIGQPECVLFSQNWRPLYRRFGIKGVIKLQLQLRRKIEVIQNDKDGALGFTRFERSRSGSCEKSHMIR